jgi:dihydroorotate dehydrogenase (NAD+) catalytic subunit
MRRGRSAVDLTTTIGPTVLPSPILTASGTSGHGAELSAYGDLAGLGAVVTKSVAAFEWAGNAPPRLHALDGAMINSVGLQGAGVDGWLNNDLPALVRAGARVVASIWGRTVDDYAAAAERLSHAGPEVIAVEVNLSCPNLEGKGMFAQSTEATEAAMRATVACKRPRWAKLTAMVADLPAIASAAVAGGASALTLVNTLPAMVLDVDERRPVLGAGGGGLSGPAIHPVAVRAVWDVHAVLDDVPIVGVGGVTSGRDAIELMLAGASAVEVGTASFADPRAPWRVHSALAAWCVHHDVVQVHELVGAAHTKGVTP